MGAELAGIKGPCPRCGAVISAPSAVRSEAEVIPPSKGLSSRGGNVLVERRGRSTGRRRGRISADSIIDHRHQGSRETTRTLFILSMFILVFFLCIVVTWFLKDWMAR